MVTYSRGILGGFLGTVGTVVDGNWKGISYMRSQSGKRSGTSTPAQLAQQTRFNLAIKFLVPFTDMLRITFLFFVLFLVCSFFNHRGHGGIHTENTEASRLIDALVFLCALCAAFSLCSPGFAFCIQPQRPRRNTHREHRGITFDLMSLYFSVSSVLHFLCALRGFVVCI